MSKGGKGTDPYPPITPGSGVGANRINDEAVLVFSLVLSSSFNAIFSPDHRCYQVKQLRTQSPSSERLNRCPCLI